METLKGSANFEKSNQDFIVYARINPGISSRKAYNNDFERNMQLNNS